MLSYAKMNRSSSTIILCFTTINDDCYELTENNR